MASTVTFDDGGIRAALAKLASPELRVSLSRSMGVAGGKVLRDEAKRNAPIFDPSDQLPGSSREPTPGLLRDSIYLAFREKMSGINSSTYMVSWNSKKTRYGHLVEFGHWRHNAIVNGQPKKSLGKTPTKSTSKKGKAHGGSGALEQPVFVPAQPFLRPAFDLVGTVAKQAMIERGRVRAAELLKGIINGS